MRTEVSVIIPCLNEVSTIGNTLKAASHELEKSGLKFEIIVIDNGSKDGSDNVALKHNAKLIYSDAYPVGAVRNVGVNTSQGKVLVFIDADIVLQKGWGDIFRSIYYRMIEDDKIITGSHPLVPDDIRPLLYQWYKSLSEDLRDTHLGTGHMIVSRNIFNKIGGFDESLVTNEDFYFCHEAKKLGITVVSNQEMKVFHYGYPNTLTDFVKREIWHGFGDCNNWGRLVRSRIAWSGSIFFLLIVSMVAFIFYDPTISLFISVVLVLAACGFNYLKFGFGNLRNYLYRSFVSFLYLFSRGVALPIFFIKRKKVHHRGHKKIIEE